MYTIVVTPRSFGAVSARPLELLQEKGFTIIHNPLARPLKQYELLELTKDADALITGLDEVSATVIGNSPKLRVISKYGVGTDNIDLAAAREKGIVVTTTPGANTEAVADLTVGLMLCVARRITEADRSVKKGEWKKILGVSLYGKTAGILGTGQIGRAVARRLRKGFNSEILLYDRYPDHNFARSLDAAYVSLDEIFSRCHFISVNLPLVAETAALIDAEAFRRMRADAILVNTSRGGIVDENALVNALRSKTIRGAALDVFAEEPLARSELFYLPNLVLTPHIGAYTEEALLIMGVTASQNVIDVLEGRLPATVV